MHTPSWICFTLLAATISPTLAMKNALEGSRLFGRCKDPFKKMIHRRMEELTDGPLVARMPQTAPPAPSQSAGNANLTGSDPSNIDQTLIDAALSAACDKALDPVRRVPNNAGVLACYNIPFLNTQTGVFESDLRLFQFSPPKGDFKKINPTELSLQLSYPNAAFSTVPKASQRRKREPKATGRDDPLSRTPLETFLFVGQISKTLTLSKLTDMDLMALLIPRIRLTAERGSAPDASTDLTSRSMVMFVSGVFEGQGATGVAAAAPGAAAAAATKASAFSLPGTTLGILPVGLIITSIWALLFFVAVGFGTWERIKFRKQFRLRKEQKTAAVSQARASE